MRNLFLHLVLVCGVMFTPYAHAAKPAAADFTLDGIDGQVELAKFKGQVVYLDFWASWCTPCRASFPWMNEMQRRYGKQGLKIVAVNLDSEKEMAREFISATHPNFTIAFDPDGTVAEQYNVMGMPSSYLIDRKGRLHSTHVGFRAKDRAALEKSLVEMLGNKE
jgi:cytochrome c biogenesis protein CcmG, thiol:disulfide interchange protein DsbE